ncbi:MAG: hypothetical protein ACAH65_04760 [Chloroflexota bacterium]
MNPFTIESQQTVLVEGLTGPDGATQMYITSGFIQLMGGAQNTTISYSGLVEPTLTAGQFRRAIVTAAPATLAVWQMGMPPAGVTQKVSARWSVSSADADWDDESGKIELQFETQASGDPALYTVVERLSFQALIFVGP